MCQIYELKSRQLQEPHKNTNQVRTRSLKKEISLFYVIQDYNSLHTKQKKTQMTSADRRIVVYFASSMCFLLFVVVLLRCSTEETACC